jgi:tetratricopeptide (TPR) repeat protein
MVVPPAPSPSSPFVRLPSPPPPTLEPPSPTGASAEAGILRAALTALHHNNDPAAALALLDQYDARFPKGTLRGEATLARAHSLRQLGRDDELLRLLERVSFADVPRAAELRVLRGELRLTRRRFADALNDFEAALVAGAPDPIVERALFGRASCRARLGDTDGARADLRRYLERFPASPRAGEVRARLAR